MAIRIKRAYEAPSKSHGARLRETALKGTLTIVYAAKNEEHNNAVVLKEFLETRRGET